jgi:hypothetical protein
MSRKNIILRIGIVYRNPTKVQLNYLTNTLFTSKDTLVNNYVSFGYENRNPDYQSNSWLQNVNIINKLSILDYDKVIITKPTSRA